MIDKNKFHLDKFEQQMRENAYAIANLYDKMKAIDNHAANKALNGIAQYLDEKNNANELAELAENDENFYHYGIITKDEYLTQKHLVEQKYGH